MELVALAVAARRTTLLRVHRHRLRADDLEECFSQAALELVLWARRGASFASQRHAAAVLEQRFVSRIQDRRRAIEGRSVAQAELERALAAGALEREGCRVSDPGGDVEHLVMLRDQLALLPKQAEGLTPDQRLVLACQVALQMGCRDFCEQFGWTADKYRKVAQRARARLRLIAES
ncbi:MAG TPA: hypothetical protein VGF95_09260 [Solirubrobacteraceae bacterium]